MPAGAHDPRKFRELILYVARESEADPRCGATKLNKLLFYADFGAYRRLGRSISGCSYRKREYGPTPDGILRTIAGMEQEGLCAWAERDYFGFPLKKLVALREPDLSVFSSQELGLVRNVIGDLWEMNATEVSDLSHRFVGWQAAAMGEEIAYNSVFVGDPRPLTDEEARWALEAAREFGGQQAAT